MRFAIARLVCCCLLITLFTAGVVVSLPAREWTGSTGLKIEADLIGYDGKTAKLKLATGSVLPVPLDKLSQADQDYLKQTYPNGKEDAEEAAKAKAKAAKKKANEEKSGKKATKKAVAKKAAAKKEDELADATPEAPAAPAEEMPAENADGFPDDPPAATSGGVNVEVVGLTINKPGKQPTGPGGMAINFGPFAAGTHIRLALTDPQRQIIGVDEASKIASCVDDQGTDLLKATGAQGPMINKMLLQPSADGKGGTIDLDQPEVPAKAATKITLAGELLVVCGVGEKSEDVAEQPLTKGTRFKIGANAVRFGDIRKQPIGEMKMLVTLESPKPFSGIKKILLVNDAGEESETVNLGSASVAAGKSTLYQRVIGLNEALEKVKLKVVTFESTETVKVPLALEVGLGL